MFLPSSIPTTLEVSLRLTVASISRDHPWEAGSSFQKSSLMFPKCLSLKLQCHTEIPENEIMTSPTTPPSLITCVHLGHEATLLEPSPTKFLKNQIFFSNLTSLLRVIPKKLKGIYCQGTCSGHPLHPSVSSMHYFSFIHSTTLCSICSSNRYLFIVCCVSEGVLTVGGHSTEWGTQGLFHHWAHFWLRKREEKQTNKCTYK